MANEQKGKWKKMANKKAIFLKCGDENERQMENNVNCKEMIFVIRNLIDVDDASPATAPEIPLTWLQTASVFSPNRKG